MFLLLIYNSRNYKTLSLVIFSAFHATFSTNDYPLIGISP